MPKGLLIGIDVGTQSIRALLMDGSGRNLACVRCLTPTIRLDDNSAEYDPEALWISVVDLLRELASQIPTGQTVAGISCASIGESCVLVGSAGQALAPALAWFDHRTKPDGLEVAARIGIDRLFAITGYPPDPTLTLCKLLWHRRTQPELFARAYVVLPIAPWILFKLSGVAAVDPSLAARTLCLDVHKGTWASDIITEFGIDESLLPPILPSGTPLGPALTDVLRQTGLPGTPAVSVGAQDHIAGGFAAGATLPGIFLHSLGTSEALLVTNDRPVLTPQSTGSGFVQTSAAIDDRFYLIGSGLNRSGGAIEWAFRTFAAGVSRGELIEEARAEPPGSGGVLFVPNLAGSSAPNPDPDAAGAFAGLTDATRRGAMLRAVFEGVAMEARLVTEALFSLPGVIKPSDFRIIGGGIRNSLFLEIKASVFGEELVVCEEAEMTATGAALLAGIGAGLWENFDDALSSASLTTRNVGPNLNWKPIYEELFTSCYSVLRTSLGNVDQCLAAFRSGKI